MRAFGLDDKGNRWPIEARRALLEAQAGTPILLEGALVEFGLLPAFVDLFVAEVAALTSRERAEHLRSVGLERLHEVLDPDQVVELITRLDRRMVRDSVALARAVVNATTSGRPPHYFVCARTFVRAQIPLRLLASRADLLATPHLQGHLRPTEAHRDVLLTHPRGSLSIWCAVGPVSPGNTVALFTESERDPITPALAPGDLLLFNADRLHATVPNHTDNTRVGVGTRIVLGRWLRFGPGTHWRPWYDVTLIDTPFERFATLQSRLTPAALRRWRWRRRWNRQQRAARARR
jgi:hypothetical protein